MIEIIVEAKYIHGSGVELVRLVAFVLKMAVQNEICVMLAIVLDLFLELVVVLLAVVVYELIGIEVVHIVIIEAVFATLLILPVILVVESLVSFGLHLLNEHFSLRANFHSIDIVGAPRDQLSDQP